MLTFEKFMFEKKQAKTGSLVNRMIDIYFRMCISKAPVHIASERQFPGHK